MNDIKHFLELVKSGNFTEAERYVHGWQMKHVFDVLTHTVFDQVQQIQMLEDQLVDKIILDDRDTSKHNIKS